MSCEKLRTLTPLPQNEPFQKTLSKCRTQWNTMVDHLQLLRKCLGRKTPILNRSTRGVFLVSTIGVVLGMLVSDQR